MITIEEVKRYLNIDDSEVDLDLFLEQCINYTFSEIENYCRQPIALKEQEKTFKVVGNSIIFNQYPINEITNVEIYDDYFNLIETVSDTDYILNLQSSLYFLIFNSDSYNGYNAKVTYSCGYNSIPNDLLKVHIEMIAIMFKESDVRGGLGGGRIGLSSNSENINSISTNINFSVPTERWNKILNRYRAVIG